MSAGTRRARRMTGTLLGAALAVAGSVGVVAGLSGVAAAAPTPEASSVTLNAITSPVAVGSETQTFTGTVTGQPTDGYPTGTVKVETSGNLLLCTETLPAGSGDSASFSCSSSTSTLSAGSYTIRAHYTGGSSSKAATFTYTASTSGSRALRVTTPETSTVTLNPITSPVAYGFETQTFTGTVTGQAGDGYPKGTVTVETTTSVVLCKGTLFGGSGDTASFSCTQSTPTKLAASGTAYEVHAHYRGGTSSAATFSYKQSTSTTRPLMVVAPTTETPTVSLNAITSPVVFGAEDQTFRGTVTGQTGHGYPTTGAVTVRTASTVVICTGSLTAGAGFAANYTCSQNTASKLAVGTYTVHAHYTGGASSNVNYKYGAASSSPRALKVTAPIATTTVLTLNHTSRVLGGETSEVFTATVTGKSGDGYPKGKVTIQTTTARIVCSTSTRTTGTSDSSTFTCSPAASTLPIGSYKVTATFAPTATHSSSTSALAYATSTSTKQSFSVVTGVATTSSLSLNFGNRRAGSETSEVFTVTVTGKSGDGYPKGTVKVKTSGGTLLCTRTTPASHTTDAATYSCSPKASALAAGTYTIVAVFTPASPSSSTTTVTYAGSTSNSASLTITALGSTRIAGTTPDGTAAKALESVFPGNRGTCPGTTGNRPVVLATDEHFPDALAASYLEKWLGTGMLLTPTASLTNVTLTALQVEGITHVYVVGGPLAVSTAVVTQLQNSFAYQCGGATRTGSHLTVTRIYGTTQYTTAEDIAKTPGSAFVGSFNLHGAYGLYNDTTGKSSAAPATGSLRTAVLASGAGFQDAEAAATLAYAEDLPLLLTTPTALSGQALSAMQTLGVTQVILMGGPLAVSNAVVTALVAHRISVVRVAGTDYTDTAGQLADMELGSATGHKGFAWTPTGGVTVAQGHFYSDGLAGAVVSAHGGATGAGPQPLLLTENPTTVGTPLTNFLRGAGTSGIDGDGTPVSSLTILGGPLAVTTAVVNAMLNDL
jgi:putative cell wall-binding protein